MKARYLLIFVEILELDWLGGGLVWRWGNLTNWLIPLPNGTHLEL